MGSIPNVDIEIPEVHQVAIVVEDLVDGMERFRSIFGIEPWTVFRLEPPELTDTTYYGDSVEYGMRLAHGYAGETDIELIEPTQGPNIYADHLEAHGEGLHHIKSSWLDDEERTFEAVEKLQDAGIPIIQSGKYKGSEFWYFDTAKHLNGLVFETSVRRNMDEREPEMIYPDDHESQE